MDKIIEQLIDKMDETSYDDTVILGTLLVLLESNKSAYGAVLKPENIEITEDTDIFADIVSVLLNGITVEKEFKFKDFTAKYNNLPQKLEVFIGSDLEKTQKNFEQNFVNLAQVFYEMQFCGDKLETTNTNIQNLMVLVENILLTKRKSLQVTYYNNKRLSNDDRIKQEEFANIANVDFERVPTLRDLKKKVSVPTDSTIKHQIVVLDDPAMVHDKIEELINLCNVYTVFILVNIPGFLPEKEFVRIVSIMASPVIKGGADANCGEVQRIIQEEGLAIGRHIFSENVLKLKSKLGQKITDESLQQCLNNLNYKTVGNKYGCKKILTLLKDIFDESPQSVNMMEYNEYKKLIKHGSDIKTKKEIQNCLKKLGYQFESCKGVNKFITSNPKNLDNEIIVDFNNLVQKGLKNKPKITEETLRTCIPQLGYTIEIFVDLPQEPVSSSVESKTDEQYCNEVQEQIKKKDYDNYNKILQDFPDEKKLSKCLQNIGYLSEDCVNVLNEIRTNNFAVGKFIIRQDFNQLSEKLNNNEEELNKCLETLGFKVAKDDCVMTLTALKQLIKDYKITGNALTLEQYKKLLKLVFRDKEPTEEERDELNKCLTYLEYEIKKTDQPPTEVSNDSDLNLSTNTEVDKSASSTDTSSTDVSSTDVSSTDATVAVASTAVAPTDAFSSSPEKPDPSKHTIGMYHGCSYKGYDFRAEINETSSPQHTKVSGDDIDTIVRYFIFSNIVVFIVN